MTTLPRTLGLRDLILLIIGTVIGSGIFIVPGAVLRQVNGSVGPAMLAWLAAGILSLLGALTYAELSTRDPKAGGLYVYIRHAFGPLPAFLYGWTLFFAIGSGSAATLAVAFSLYLDRLVPLTPLTAKLMAVGMLTVVVGVNVRGTRHSANLQNWATAMKVGAILIMSVALLGLGGGAARSGAEVWFKVGGASLSGFGLAMISVLWAYEGWHYCSFSAGEALQAQRHFPRAFLTGSVALVTIYLLANLAYLAALGSIEAARTDSIASTAVAVVMGPTAARLVTIAILISMLSAANGLTLTCPRVYYAMALDGLFFRRMAEVHPRFQTPALAVLTSGAWAAVLAATGTFEQLLTYVVFSGWIFYALGAASLLVYRTRDRDSEASGSYRVPGYPWTPLLFIAAAAALVVNMIITQPSRAAAGLGIVLLGVPAYIIWRWRSRSRVEDRATPMNVE